MLAVQICQLKREFHRPGLQICTAMAQDAPMLDWNDLRYFLELSRSGKLAPAARRLGVDHTTVSRRVHALEKALGAPLFTREPSGFVITESGRRLLPQAELMESAILSVERTVSDRDSPLSGTVRVGTTEGLGAVVLAPALAGFALAHPGLSIDLLALPRQVSLPRREADIVIALERPVRGPFIVSRLTDYSLRLYGAPDYLARLPTILDRDSLAQHSFVGYVDDLLFSKELQYLNELCRPERFSLRSTSVLAQREAIAAGAGIGVLPDFLAAQDERLVPILPAASRLVRTFWMSMPVEIKHLTRHQATWEFLRHTVEAQRPRLMGGIG